MCMCRSTSYFIQIKNDACVLRHSVRHTLHISPGSHECGESGRAIDRVQAFSFVAFKVQVYHFFSQGGNQPSPLRCQIALSEPISFGEASKLPRQIQSAELCTTPSPFTARFQGTLVADDVTTVFVPE